MTLQIFHFPQDLNSNNIFTKLPYDIFVYLILDFIRNDLKSLLSLSSVCKDLRSRLLSKDLISYWNPDSKNWTICIDDYCTNCNVGKAMKSPTSAFRFLELFPIKNMIIHCFITDIPYCLQGLSKQDVIENLYLTPTNKLSSPPLDVLLEHLSISFSKLLTFSFDSSHLKHINLAGRAKLLDLFGRNLLKLQFINLSPSGVFSIISTRCPRLEYLRIDRAQTFVDMEEFQSMQLKGLELLRCNFAPSIFQLPSLIKLKYSPSFKIEERISSFFEGFPQTLISLSLELPSSVINKSLVFLSSNLPNLVDLQLEGTYENGVICQYELGILGVNCRQLKNLELIVSKSTISLCFESIECFQIFNSFFTNLETLKIMFNMNIFNNLILLLLDSSIASICLKIKKKLVLEQFQVSWEYLEKKIRRMNDQLSSKYILFEEF